MYKKEKFIPKQNKGPHEETDADSSGRKNENLR